MSKDNDYDRKLRRVRRLIQVINYKYYNVVFRKRKLDARTSYNEIFTIHFIVPPCKSTHNARSQIETLAKAIRLNKHPLFKKTPIHIIVRKLIRFILNT